MLRVLEHILMTWPAPQPEHRSFNDAIRDLQTESMVELQRLASKMPDPLLVSYLTLWLSRLRANHDPQEVYDQLEAKVKEMIASGTLDEKRQVAYQSFLFIIMYGYPPGAIGRGWGYLRQSLTVKQPSGDQHRPNGTPFEARGVYRPGEESVERRVVEASLGVL